MAKKTEGPSKADMVRDAVSQLGWDKTVADYHAYILSTYSVDMTKPHISQQLSNERKKNGKGPKRRGRKKGSKNKTSGGETAPAAAVAATSGSVSIADLFEFIGVLSKWEAKLGAAAIKDALKHIAKN
jgi:hypothetical protein